MPFQGLDDGLYLVKRHIEGKQKGFWHYGVIDIANVSGILQIPGPFPLLIHQIPPGLRSEYIFDFNGFEFMGKVMPEFEHEARQRIWETWKNPKYNLFGNNCEHFARYVTTGKKESKQLQAFGGIAALAAVCVVCFIFAKSN